MAVSPTKDYYNPDLTNYLSSPSIHITFVSDGDVSVNGIQNSIVYTGSNTVDTIAVKWGTNTNILQATAIGTYMSNTTGAKATLNKTSSTIYLFFQFLSGTTSRGYARFTMNSTALPNGTYYVYLGNVRPGSKIINNIMIYSSSYTSTIDWDAFHSPIACSTDFESGSSDTKKSVILYNSSTDMGYATLSNGKTLDCHIWNNLTHSYVNNQAIRYCDIACVKTSV
jgi:hypothetical protein